MKKASKLFIGEHDFRSFCSNEKEKANCIRNIYSIKIIKHNNVVFKVEEVNEKRIKKVIINL